MVRVYCTVIKIFIRVFFFFLHQNKRTMNFAFNNAHYPPPSFGKDLVAAFLALLTYTRRPLLILPELYALYALSAFSKALR